MTRNMGTAGQPISTTTKIASKVHEIAICVFGLGVVVLFIISLCYELRLIDTHVATYVVQRGLVATGISVVIGIIAGMIERF